MMYWLRVTTDIFILFLGLSDRNVRQVHCGDSWTAAIIEHKWEPLFGGEPKSIGSIGVTTSSTANIQTKLNGHTSVRNYPSSEGRKKIIDISIKSGPEELFDDTLDALGQTNSSHSNPSSFPNSQSNSPTRRQLQQRALHPLQPSSSSPLPMPNQTTSSSRQVYQIDPYRAKTIIELEYYKNLCQKLKSECKRLRKKVAKNSKEKKESRQ